MENPKSPSKDSLNPKFPESTTNRNRSSSSTPDEEENRNDRKQEPQRTDPPRENKDKKAQA